MSSGWFGKPRRVKDFTQIGAQRGDLDIGVQPRPHGRRVVRERAVRCQSPDVLNGVAKSVNQRLPSGPVVIPNTDV